MRPLALVVASLFACGSSPARTSATAPPAAAPSPPATVTLDCWLGADRCPLQLDLDGDGRADTITPVRDTACSGESDDDAFAAADLADDDEPIDPEDEPTDRPCQQGLWLALATGPTQLVGAGGTLARDPAATEDDEPLDLEGDLGFLRLLSITQHREGGGLNAKQLLASPCDGDALVLSSSDAALLLCWRAGTARAYHLGY
jgi:hypothetical protein